VVYNPRNFHARSVLLGIVLPHPLSVEEIRVLQEFRRLAIDSLAVETIRKIKHPAGGGEAPAVALVRKGYLTSDATRENYSLTPKSKDFLAIDYKPIEETSRKSSE
jgi:hypothetical protein